MEPTDDIRALAAGELLLASDFGARAARLSEMAMRGVAVPDAIALSARLIGNLETNGDGPLPFIDQAVDLMGGHGLLAIRASVEDPEWGGPASVFNVGLTESRIDKVSEAIGAERAEDLFLRFILYYATAIAGIDMAAFDTVTETGAEPDGAVLTSGAPWGQISEALQIFERESDTAFPSEPGDQVDALVRTMARSWLRPSARMLRQAKGAPEHAGMGVVLQDNVVGGINGWAQGVDSETGMRKITGGLRVVAAAGDRAHPTGGDDTLDQLDAPQTKTLERGLETSARILGDAAMVEFVVGPDGLQVVDVSPAKRAPRAGLQIAVDLVDQGVISKASAILKTNPQQLGEHLHPQIAPDQDHDVICRGIAASSGAAIGRVVFSSEGVAATAARDEPAILVRNETAPEDIRGMNRAAGVLTLTGGLTSHAAVIAQGIGVPCVVGASELRIDAAAQKLIAPGGRVINEGEMITIDGTRGWVMLGGLELVQNELPEAFATIMQWADETRDIAVRANADSAEEARLARRFLVDGIGLCRTEHMFYDVDRLKVMRELILAEDHHRREKALRRLLPMQRGDFVELFEIMEGLPVTIRLLDPPLHEFLPTGSKDIRDLAEAMDQSEETLRQRIDEMAEFNPMLGKRGVRLAVTMPEIYEMQARAIFEAAGLAARTTGHPVVPEIMIPLVSAKREVELVRARIDAVARTVEGEQGYKPDYKLGVMVETPRAALRAGDLATESSFLSFGTNDLTQMTYGLSRDDSGRFMREYVHEGVFPEDPFLTLDLEGVGELLLTAAKRAMGANTELILGLCGEHGGDPASIRFCAVAGFNYVSCSPYRVPIARLAAAQATLLSRRQ